MAIQIGGGITIGGGIGFATGAPVALEAAPTTLAQEYGGGYYFGTIDYSGGSGTQKYYLVVAPKSTQTSLAWGLADTIPNSFADGYSNTYAVPNTASYPAAQYARALSTGGFTDWYVPSFYEMDMLLTNLKPYNVNNNFESVTDGITIGVNPYSVPVGTGWTTTVPAWSANTAFRGPSGAQSFNGDNIASSQWWTSTERLGQFTMHNFIGGFTAAASNALGLPNMYGQFGAQFKTDAKNVRCIRRVAYYA
jgi:hypothetical protein